MVISARVRNSKGVHSAVVTSGGEAKHVSIAPMADGYGSGVSGGELLFLALATCYCNDVYREAKKRGIEIREIEVEVSGSFGGEGDIAHNVRFRPRIKSSAPWQEVQELLRFTDTVAEVQKTLRQGIPVELSLEAEQHPVVTS
jgi:uncharacterized OsmC-like protein